MTNDAQRAAAEDALMDALEAWARSLGDGGVTQADGKRYFPTRSIPWMRKAHAKGTLIDSLTGWLPDYRGLGHSPGSAQRMVDIVKHGLQPWEYLLVATDRPWSPFVTDEQRAVLHEVLRDCHAQAASELRLRAKIQQQVAQKHAQD